MFHVSRNQRKSEVAILISDKIEFKTKNVTRDQKEQVSWTVLKREIGSNTIRVKDINAPIDSSWRKLIKKQAP